MALALASAGCGGLFGSAPPAPSPAALLGPISPTTAHVVAAAKRTLHLTASTELDIAYSQSQDFLGRGTFDFPRGVGTEQVTAPTGVERLLYLPRTVFDRQAPNEYLLLPEGKSWLSAEPAEKGSQRYEFFVLQVEDLNPDFLLGQLAWGAVSAQAIASGTVDGAPASEYSVEVDLVLAASSAAGPSKASLAAGMRDERAALARGVSGVDGQFEMDAWIDGAGRVVQVQLAPPGSWGRTTLTFTAFHGTVQAALPPRSEVVDLLKLSGHDPDSDIA